MREIDGVEHLHLVSFARSRHRCSEITGTINGKNGSIIKGGCKKCRSQMTPVMLHMVNFCFDDFFIDRRIDFFKFFFREKQFFLHSKDGPAQLP